MALDPRDPDGDSEMASSADSIHTDSDGAGSGARTPTGNRATAASELSPPGSQTQQMPYSSMTYDQNSGAGTLNTRQASDKTSEPRVAAWKSKRAQEEYQRAMEHVIDKDFTLDEFGDPFDERDLEQKLL